MHNAKNDPDIRIEDPRLIDWPARQAMAAVPFHVFDGLPMNPMLHVDLLDGRGELWHWGEAVCSDAIVFADLTPGNRHILLIERGDGHGWALPGGGLDAGETAIDGCVRELAEETGLQVTTDQVGQMLRPRVVPDPRAGVNAWMVTIPGVIHLDQIAPVDGMDDATDAAWFPANSWGELVEAINQRPGGKVFAAHVSLLRESLEM